MNNIVKNTDNRNGSITQTININKITFKLGDWFKRIFRREKYYNELASLLSNQLKLKIESQKTNKKYIPDVFLELNEVKEFLRYITQPILFYNKDINEIKNVKFIFFNSVLERLDFKKKNLKIENHLQNVKFLYELNNSLKNLKVIFNDFKNSNPNPNIDRRKDLKENLSEEKYKLAIKEEVIYRRLGWFIDDFEKRFELLSKKFILLTEKAGQGKTNLLCDFVDKVMLKKDLLGVMFSGNEFNNLTRDQIEDVILKSIYPFNSKDKTFAEFLLDIECLCKKRNATFTILIDGLNENSDVEKFSEELYKFIEKILEKDYIRLIFTCRSEYFDQRFKQFKQPSFEKDMLILDNYMQRYHLHDEKLPDYLEDRLIGSYFDFFQVKNTVFPDVRYQLSNDFLLLRIFCEVYGKKDNPSAPTEQIYDIYKEELFAKYFQFKQDQITNKNDYTLTDFQNIFETILKYMIDNNQFINIPFENLQTVNRDLLNKIIDEDIFFRRDIIKDETSVFANSEVLNFTFDEFRDYLLADYLVNCDVNILDFLNKTENNTTKEGIEKYLFFKSRKQVYRQKLSFLENLEYYNDLFIDNIFSVKDKDVTRDDINKIQELFILKKDFSERIISLLMYRHRTNHYKNLNILILCDMIYRLTSEQYRELVNPKFKVKYDYYSRSRSGYTLELLKYLDKILNTKDFSQDPDLHNVFEFIFLLLGVEDEENYRIPYELIELLENYINKYPSNAKNILIKYHDIQIEPIQLEIWKLLNYCIDKQIDFDSSFCQKIFDKFSQLEDGVLKNQYQSFLEKCFHFNNNLFTDNQKKSIKFLIDDAINKQNSFLQNLLNDIIVKED